MNKRNMTNINYYIGKKLDLNKWNIPEGYELCAKTGKFYAISDLCVTFAHWMFDRNWLIEKNIMIEDAAWLSEEGYDQIIEVVKAEGKYDQYCERMVA